MSRSGYTDECDEDWQVAMWRGAVASAIRGKRGQRLLRDLAEGMDAMPTKCLIKGELEEDGAVCALGVVGQKRGIGLAELAGNEESDGGNNDKIAEAFDVALALACEVQYINDEGAYDEYKRPENRETPAQRWERVRRWIAEHLRDARG